ncbi:MAG: DUF819 family protein [Gammaproteobacteria bacterium]|nr:DUF819 family protein [Gammaproteobacteria bacterium]
MSLLLVLLFLLTPAIFLKLIHASQLAQKIGVIILCYGAGIIVGNLNIIPQSFQPIQNTLAEVSIALALPMLLFTLNIRQWGALARKAMLSMLFATCAVVTCTSFLFFYLQAPQHNSTELAQLAGMSVGVYTGGTPNLAAIKSGLNIDNNLYLIFHSFDTLIGASYMLFMVSIAIPVFRFLLNQPDQQTISPNTRLTPDDDDYSEFKRFSNFKQIAQICFLSVAIVGFAVGISEFVKSIFNVTNSGSLTIILLTTAGIVLSLSERIRALTLSYKMGMYLIYVFCFAVASMANLNSLINFEPMVAVFLLSTIVFSLILHALLCRIFNIDSDTFMVTSVSAICSPPFVPMMAKALNNPNILLSGMTTGIIGYALGNYLGISLAMFLQAL